MIRRTPLKRGKPPKKKTSARKLKQQCDMIVRTKVFERDGDACCRCGTDDNLQAAHVYPKGSYPRLRFLEVNILCLCLRDHLYWAHKSPIEFSEWFLKAYPERAAQLRLLKDTAPKVNLKELLAELRSEI